MPAGYESDSLAFPGGDEALRRAREVMAAALTGAELPPWFKDFCIDDASIQTCEVKSWSLRAWRYWLQPENRRWWWWSAAVSGDEVRLGILVRSKPYLKGSLEWLFKAAAEAPP